MLKLIPVKLTMTGAAMVSECGYSDVGQIGGWPVNNEAPLLAFYTDGARDLI